MRLRLARGPEAGYSLVALLASISIMLILMAAATPTWKYIMKDDREEELIAHGIEIADAIKRYQEKVHTFPTSLEVMVKGRYLRRAYKDPMTKDGKWRFIRQGEVIPAVVPGAQPPGGRGGAGDTSGSGTGAFGNTTTTTTPTTRPSGPGSLAGQTIGPMLGVASTSTEKGLRVVNGRTKYSEWLFIANQPVTVGKPLKIGGGGPMPGQPPGPGAGPRPSPTPLPNPNPTPLPDPNPTPLR